MIKEYENVFTTEECQKIINECFLNLKELTQINPKIYVSGTVLEKTNPKIDWALNRLASILNTKIDNFEFPRFMKQTEGIESSLHTDFFSSKQPSYALNLKCGGQRIKSHLIYLNDDFEGGFTEFPFWNITVKPKTGKMVSWTNLKEGIPLDNEESLDLDSQHRITFINKGIRYVLIVFERISVFTGETKQWLAR